MGWPNSRAAIAARNGPPGTPPSPQPTSVPEARPRRESRGQRPGGVWSLPRPSCVYPGGGRLIHRARWMSSCRIGCCRARARFTRALLGRLWREHVRHYKPRLLLVLVLTLLMAGTTALYPVVIDHAFDMFTDRDRRILYQIPVLVVAGHRGEGGGAVFPERAGAAGGAAGDPRAAGPHVRPPDPRRPGAAGARGAGRSLPPASPPTPPRSARR